MNDVFDLLSGCMFPCAGTAVCPSFIPLLNLEGPVSTVKAAQLHMDVLKTASRQDKVLNKELEC